MYLLDLSVEGSPGGADLPRRGSGLLIPWIAIRAISYAPHLTWDYVIS
jgi:hypothetical protein